MHALILVHNGSLIFNSFNISQIDDLISEQYRHARIAKEAIIEEEDTEPPSPKGGGRTRKGCKPTASSSRDGTKDHVMKCIRDMQKEIRLIPEKCAEVIINVYFILRGQLHVLIVFHVFLQILLEKDPSSLPAAYFPLYHREDGAELAAAMPVSNERGLMSSRPPNSPVSGSFGEHSVEGEEEEEDSEETLEGMGETSPPQESELVQDLHNEDDAREDLVGGSPRSTGVVMRSGATPSWRLGRATPKKGEAASLPRGDACAL